MKNDEKKVLQLKSSVDETEEKDKARRRRGRKIDKTLERKIFFVLTVLMLIVGLFIKAGIL